MDRDLEGRDRDLEPETKPRGDDVQQLVVVKEEVPPEQQEWSPSLDQEDPAEPPHIKEEQEELWTSQEGEQLQGLEEADITKFLFTPVPVKSEDDEEKPQSSQLHQRQTEEMETGADGEDCGGPEPARNSHPDTYFICVGPQSSQLHQQDKTEDSSDTEDSDDWSKDIREPPSGSKSLKMNEVSKSGARCNTEENPLSCSLCGKVFKGKGTLKRHMAVHTGEKLFSCSVCERSFKRKPNMKRHMAVHTGDKPFQCSVCGKAFTEKGTLTQHMFVHSAEKMFKCSVCGKGFTQKPQLTRHMGIHSAEKPFRCSVCEKGFTQKGLLTHHMTIHTGEKIFSCSDCDQRFTWDKQLRRHKLVCPQSSRLHQTEQDRESEPGASSSTEQLETGADGEDCGGPEPDRNSHPDTHLQPETEDNEDWNYTTKHESSVHLGKIGSTQAESHKCVSPQSSQLHQQDETEDSSDTEDSDDWSKDIREPPAGSKSLNNNEVSKSGVRCNTKGNPLSCSLCGKAFRQKRNLRRHMSVHTGEKRFSCSVCERSFSQKDTVTRHMAIHTGDKPFKCSVCEKSFTRRGHLTQHMFVHSAEKTFKCSVCEKAFSRKAQLTRHMGIHSAEKPFRCSVCEKGFTQKGLLTHHMTIHTGEKIFSCSDCDQRFTWDKQLRRHKSVCPQSSRLHQTEQDRESEPGASSSTEQLETGADGEDCGGPEPDRNSHPDTHLHETEDSEDWNDTAEHEASVNLGKKPISYSKGGKRFCRRLILKRHMRTHTEGQQISCSVRGKSSTQTESLTRHTSVNTGPTRAPTH